MAPLQGILVALFMFTGIPLYYTFVTGWKRFPGLRMSLKIVVLIPGFLGINFSLERLTGRQSLTNVTAWQRGYRLADEGDAMLPSNDTESTRAT